MKIRDHSDGLLYCDCPDFRRGESALQLKTSLNVPWCSHVGDYISNEQDLGNLFANRICIYHRPARKQFVAFNYINTEMVGGDAVLDDIDDPLMRISISIPGDTWDDHEVCLIRYSKMSRLHISKLIRPYLANMASDMACISCNRKNTSDLGSPSGRLRALMATCYMLQSEGRCLECNEVLLASL